LDITADNINTLIETNDFFHFKQGLFCTVSLDKIGYEILLRSNLGKPDIIFYEAKTVKRLYELEVKSIYKLFKTYFSQERVLKEHLFINVYPSTLLDDKFQDFAKMILSHFPIRMNKVVFEIIETEIVENVSLLKERIIFLKSLGFLIAVDDVGKGWSSLSMIIELEPNYLKLDRYFSINLSKSILKQEMIKSILDYAQKFNIQVVLEGIEYSSDLAIAKQLGIPFCQGYLLEKPKLMAR
jgi:EAL domain-containing protein (putative c-di-GMP-specific phosphodiesterase class I)